MPEWKNSTDVDSVEPRLDERVLALLASSSGLLAFNGLRRALRVHPESLSRALRRLEREGVVRRGQRGYSLREPAPGWGEADDARRLRSIASVELPLGADRTQTFGALAGRWLGDLRWVGIFEKPEDPWLVWAIAEGPGNVILRIRRGRLNVMVDSLSDPTAQRHLDDAARELLATGLSRILQFTRDGSRPLGANNHRASAEKSTGVTEFHLGRSISSVAG